MAGDQPDGKLARHVPIVLYADEWGGVGGTANYVIMLARGLIRQGYRVAAICHATERVAAMRAQLAEAGVDVRAIEGHDATPQRGRLRRLAAFVSLFREYQGCVVALMMGYFTRGGNAALAAALGGASAIVRADLTPPEPPITERQKLALRIKDHLVDRVVVGAIENRQAFAHQMGRCATKIDVIHTGIELDRFCPGRGRDYFRQELGLGERTCVVGTLSRLDDERKGLRYFLEMAARLAPAAPEARFLIVGDGVLRPMLEQRATELGIRDRVTFTGWRTDIPRVLAGIDIFVMPSLFEGGPTTVLEAMAMAKPVVASNVGMVPEVIDHGRSGLIVAPGDAVAMAQAVSTLLWDETLRMQMGQNARSTAERDFSIDIMVDRYLQVFARAQAERSRHLLRRLTRLFHLS
jgi:glycosyltransferase involved in cell wall biosynthesis